MNNCFDARRQPVLRWSLVLLCCLSPAAVWAAVTAGPAWIREVPPSSPVAAVFLTLTNSGEKPVRLLAIESPLAEKVHWHDMVREGGVMRMKVQRKVMLPARSRVELAPGGGHLMLLGLRQPLGVGMKVPLTLRFDNRQSLSVVAVVRAVDADAGTRVDSGGAHDHHH